MAGARGAAAAARAAQRRGLRHVELRCAALGTGDEGGSLRGFIADGVRHEDRPRGAPRGRPARRVPAHRQAHPHLHERGHRQAALLQHDTAYSRENEQVNITDSNPKPYNFITQIQLPQNTIPYTHLHCP